MPAKRVQQLKTAVGRLVLCKPFLATAAVWLDSAARPLWVALKVLRSQNLPGFGYETNMNTGE